MFHDYPYDFWYVQTRCSTNKSVGCWDAGRAWCSKVGGSSFALADLVAAVHPLYDTRRLGCNQCASRSSRR